MTTWMIRSCARAAIAIAAAFSVTTASAAFTCTVHEYQTTGMRLVAAGANAGSGPGAGVRNPNIYNQLTSYPTDVTGILGGGSPYGVTFEVTASGVWVQRTITMSVRIRQLRSLLTSLLKGNRLPPISISQPQHSPVTGDLDVRTVMHSSFIESTCRYCGQLAWSGNDLVWSRTYRTEPTRRFDVINVFGNLAFRIHTDDPKGFQFKPSVFNRELVFNNLIESSCTVR